MENPIPPLSTLNETYGCILIATLVGMGLWGVSSAQMFYYYTEYPLDKAVWKWLVAIIWALDTTHQGMYSYNTYITLVTNFGNYNSAFTVVQATLGGVSAFICLFAQSFFIMRVWMLSHRNIYVTGVLSCLAVVQFSLQIAWMAKTLHVATFVQVLPILYIYKMADIFGAVGDLSIAASLTFLFYSSKIGVKRSDTLLTRLIVMSVNTGLLTSLSSLLSLIFVTVLPTTLIFGPFWIAISRLYTNAFLASLNARNILRASHEADFFTSVKVPKTGSDARTEETEVQFSDMTSVIYLSGNTTSGTRPTRTDLSSQIQSYRDLAIKVHTQTTTEEFQLQDVDSKSEDGSELKGRWNDRRHSLS